MAADIRLLAARGAFAPRAHEQLALLLILSDDPDPDVAQTARSTIAALPELAVARFIGRKEVPEPLRSFFVVRGIEPIEGAYEDDGPLTDAAEAAAEESSDPVPLANLPVIERMKLAIKGNREQRAQLIRDPNKLVAVAVLSSPKVTESEIEHYARMANLSEDVLRVIGTSRAWLKNYNIVAALTRNPKTPTTLAMQFVQRLNDRDLKMLAFDRNVPEPVRLAARKFSRPR